MAPTGSPSALPTSFPTVLPTSTPSKVPTPLPTPFPTSSPTTPSPTAVECTDGVLSGDESDIDCGGSYCQRCRVGYDCNYNSDCRSQICGRLDLADGEACWVRASSCVCMDTPHPTSAPSLHPSLLPTPSPTFTPPEVITISAKGYSNGTGLEINPTAKFTLESNWHSNDDDIIFTWVATQLDRHGAGRKMDLVYGETTLSQKTNEYLVLQPNVLREGMSYSFRLTVSDRFGNLGHGSLNVTAGRKPFGGTFLVQPRNGTTLLTDFLLTTFNWNDTDASSFPLSYSFKYSTKGNDMTYLDSPSGRQNMSTMLPLGTGDQYELFVGVSVSDQIGATATRNESVRVAPPDTFNDAVQMVEDKLDRIEKYIKRGKVDMAMRLMKVAADLLNHVMANGRNSTTSFGSASYLRRRLIEYEIDLVARTDVSSVARIESGLNCIEALSSTFATSLTTPDKRQVVNMVSRLGNRSAAMRSVSRIGAQAAVKSLSHVIGVGVLLNASTTTEVTDTIVGALSDLNTAVTADLVAGEEPMEFTSDNLALTCLMIDEILLSTGTFEVSVAPADAIAHYHPTSFGLPDNLLSVSGTDDDGDGSAPVMAMSWATNPYEALPAGGLQSNSSVTSLVVGSTEISGLSSKKPIIVTLPLPFGATAVEGVLEAHILNCTNGTAELRYQFTTLEIERAEYCGTRIGYQDDISASRFTDLPQASFFCADAAENFEVQCDNTSGAIAFDCPFKFSGASCEFWDTETGNWSDYGCTFWYSDYDRGFAKCNCTHLTDFSAQQKDLFEEQTSTFLDTTASAQDLTIEDISKNMGILCVLGGIWALCILLYLRDKQKHKIENMRYLLGVYRSDHLNVVLKDLRAVTEQREAKLKSSRRGSAVDERRDSQMDIIDRTRASKMAASFKLSRDPDPQVLSQVQSNLSHEIAAQRSVVGNWWGRLKEDNEILSCFYPGSWTSSAAARRGILMLAKIITLLFICCLAAPTEYLCPPEDDDGSQAVAEDDYGGAVANSFVEDYPDFIAIQKQDGTRAMLAVLLGFIWDSIMDMIYTTLWTLPALGLMVADLQLADLLDNTDALHEERLMEQAHLALVRPDMIGNLRDGLIADSMLETLEYVMLRQSKVMNSKALAGHIRAELGKLDGVPVSKTELFKKRTELQRDCVFVRQVRKQMGIRLERLRELDALAAKQELNQLLKGSSFWARGKIRKAFQAERTAYLQTMLQEVEIATMPRRLHVIAAEHNKIAESFDSRLFRRYPPRIIKFLVKPLKKYCYFNYCATDLGPMRTRMSRKQLTRCRLISLTVGLLYLLFCSFYIFLYAVMVKDNAVINSILLTVAISDGTEIIITGPLVMFLTVGILPWIAISIVMGDVNRRLGSDGPAGKVEELEADEVIHNELVGSGDHRLSGNPMFMHPTRLVSPGGEGRRGTVHDYKNPMLVGQNEVEMTAMAGSNSSHTGPAGGFFVAAAAAREYEWWLFKKNSDLAGGDASFDECSSFKRCQTLMRKRPHEDDDGQRLAYQYYDGKLFHKPVDLGAEWRWGSKNLIMWGRSVDHKFKGKMLIALDGVDMQGGDGKIEQNVSSYEEALEIAKCSGDTDSAAFWHAPSKRFIHKPKNNGARWGRGDGTLFMWADKPLFKESSRGSSGKSGNMGNVLSGRGGRGGRGHARGGVSDQGSAVDIELTDIYGEQSTDLFDDFQQVHQGPPASQGQRSFWGASRSAGSSERRRPKEHAIVVGAEDSGSDHESIELEDLYDMQEEVNWGTNRDTRSHLQKHAASEHYDHEEAEADLDAQFI